MSGSRDATLRLWDIETGQCLHVLMGHVAAVRCVQYDGNKVVSGAYDYTVKVWDPESESCTHTLQGHTNRVYSLQVWPCTHPLPLLPPLQLSCPLCRYNLEGTTCPPAAMPYCSPAPAFQSEGRSWAKGPTCAVGTNGLCLCHARPCVLCRDMWAMSVP